MKKTFVFLILALTFSPLTAAGQGSVVYERSQAGATISGSQLALKDAVWSGKKIDIYLDAVKEYREVLSVTAAGYDHASGRTFMMTSLPGHSGLPGTGDIYEPTTYNMSVVFLDDGRSFHHREATPGSTWSGPSGSSAVSTRYGFYKFRASGPARQVIANSNDPASMIAFAAAYQAGTVGDIVIRVTLRNPVTAQPSLTWVVPATSIFYEPYRPGHPAHEGWLMSWQITDPSRPNWTIKLPSIPIPSAGDPRNSTWVNPSYMTVANATVHSGGYLSYRGRWVGVLSSNRNDYGMNAGNWVSPGTLVEVLGVVP